MKIFIKNKVFFILTAIIPLLTVTCVEPDNGTDSVSAYLGDMFTVADEQVWIPNTLTGKVSELFLKSTDNRDVKVVVADNTNNPPFHVVGTGKVEKGKLSFNINKLNENYLLDGDNFLFYYFNEWYGNGNITVNPSTVKGNLITLVTQYDNNGSPSEAIIKEGFYGTRKSLTGEYIYYIYVNANCKISAGKTEKADLHYTFNKFDLSLKTGWNTILKSETYTTTGDSSYSIKVDNPETRWLMQKINSTNN